MRQSHIWSFMRHTYVTENSPIFSSVNSSVLRIQLTDAEFILERPQQNVFI